MTKQPELDGPELDGSTTENHDLLGKPPKHQASRAGPRADAHLDHL